MLKLKFQYFGHLMGRTDSLEKTLDGGKDRRQEKKGVKKDTVRWHELEKVPEDSKGWGKPSVLQSMGSHCQTRLNG